MHDTILNTETLSELPVLCRANPSVIFPRKGPVIRSFVLLNVCLHILLKISRSAGNLGRNDVNDTMTQWRHLCANNSGENRVNVNIIRAECAWIKHRFTFPRNSRFSDGTNVFRASLVEGELSTQTIVWLPLAWQPKRLMHQQQFC